MKNNREILAAPGKDFLVVVVRCFLLLLPIFLVRLRFLLTAVFPHPFHSLLVPCGAQVQRWRTASEIAAAAAAQ